MEDNFKKLDDGKMITCAVVIINKAGDILGCHGYGKAENTGYDFPKGCADVGETDIEAALRELKEETGLVLQQDQLIDCGVYKHNKEKYIHIFMHKTENMPCIENLVCTSYFEFKGQSFPEINGFKIISKDNRKMFNNVLQNKFIVIDNFNNSRL